MELKDFKKLVDSRKKKNPVWFGLESDEFPGEYMVLKAEGVLNVRLPDCYKLFIAEYGGGYFAFANIYSLDPESDWNIIENNLKYSRERNSHIIISENGLGDYFGYKVTEGVCESRVSFYDHETCIWSQTEYADIFEYLEKIALTY